MEDVCQKKHSHLNRKENCWPISIRNWLAAITSDLPMHSGRNSEEESLPARTDMQSADQWDMIRMLSAPSGLNIYAGRSGMHRICRQVKEEDRLLTQSIPRCLRMKRSERWKQNSHICARKSNF